VEVWVILAFLGFVTYFFATVAHNEFHGYRVELWIFFFTILPRLMFIKLAT
jgi:hypothetical protein